MCVIFLPSLSFVCFLYLEEHEVEVRLEDLVRGRHLERGLGVPQGVVHHLWLYKDTHTYKHTQIKSCGCVH